MYQLLFKHLLARLDPERAHSIAFAFIRLLGIPGIGKIVRSFTRPGPNLAVEALGVQFASPFGIAAGFDKEATGIRGLGNLGFGHVEVGTLTAQAQPGNPRPRLYRLIPDRALINRMGFNNHGAAEAAMRLAKLRCKSNRPIIGVNIGKSRAVAIEDAVADYLFSTQLLAPVADYLVVNVSSPNTPGLRGLQDAELLSPLLAAVKDSAGETPVLVKIAPDLTNEAIVDVCALAVQLGLAGIIATNTTLDRTGLVTAGRVIEAAGHGGLSGAPLAKRSTEVLKIMRSHVPASMCLISVGGVESATDVIQRIEAGATLVQGYTGFVYQGPLWARKINRGLARCSNPGTDRV